MKINSLSSYNNESPSFKHCVLLKDSASNKLKFLVTCKAPVNDALVSFFDGTDFYKLGECSEASELAKKLRSMQYDITNSKAEDGVRELLSKIIDTVIKRKLFSSLGSADGPILRTYIGNTPLAEMNQIANHGDITFPTSAHIKDGKPVGEINALFIG